MVDHKREDRTPTLARFMGVGRQQHNIFCLRQLQEKCIEQDRPLYIFFVDFTKAFDYVGRNGLCQLLWKYGCPEKFTTMVESLHTGMMYFKWE